MDKYVDVEHNLINWFMVGDFNFVPDSRQLHNKFGGDATAGSEGTMDPGGIPSFPIDVSGTYLH